MKKLMQSNVFLFLAWIAVNKKYILMAVLAFSVDLSTNYLTKSQTIKTKKIVR